MNNPENTKEISLMKSLLPHNDQSCLSTSVAMTTAISGEYAVLFAKMKRRANHFISTAVNFQFNMSSVVILCFRL